MSGAALAELRAGLVRRLAELGEPDLRAVAWVVEQLPTVKLAAELRAIDDREGVQARGGPKVNRPAVGREQYARTLLLVALRAIERHLEGR